MVSIGRFQSVPVGTNPFGGAEIGSQVRVGYGEFLAKPPAGTLWHRPSASDAFTLHAERRYPVLEPGDVLGLRPGGRMPKAPMGCHFVRIYESVPESKKDDAAVLYKLQGPQPAPMFAALPKPKPSLPGAIALGLPMFPPADSGKRWFPFLVDGRNLRNVQAVPVSFAA